MDKSVDIRFIHMEFEFEMNSTHELNNGREGQRSMGRTYSLSTESWMISVIICIFSFITPLYSQTWNPDPTEYAVKGITNVTASIVADSFVPMTHYRSGDWTVTGVPAWFKVDRPFGNPRIEGEDLTGMAGALGGGYATSERLMVYCIASFMTMDGALKGRLYGDPYDSVKADTEYSLFSLNAGIGYDLVPGEGRLSIPVFAGTFVQRYNAEVTLPTVNILGDDVQASVSGSGMLAGVTLGMAASYDLFRFLRITPYFLYSRSLNRPELNARISNTLPFPMVFRQSIAMDPISAAMPGLCITLISSRSLSVSLSVGGILSSSSGFYNDEVLDGLRMQSVVLAVTYRGKSAE